MDTYQSQLGMQPNQPKGCKPHKGKTMFDIEHYKKPTNWANVALWVVSIAAIVVVALDLFVWRP
jgi:hypothetical protein